MTTSVIASYSADSMLNAQDQRRALVFAKSEDVYSRPLYLDVSWPLGLTSRTALRLLDCHNFMQIVAFLRSGRAPRR